MREVVFYKIMVFESFFHPWMKWNTKWYHNETFIEKAPQASDITEMSLLKGQEQP